MSKINSLLAMYGIAANLYQYAGKDSNERIDTKSIKGNKYKTIPKGCKEYNCNGFLIIAISQKSAWKKYYKLLKK